MKKATRFNVWVMVYVMFAVACIAILAFTYAVDKDIIYDLSDYGAFTNPDLEDIGVKNYVVDETTGRYMYIGTASE